MKSTKSQTFAILYIIYIIDIDEDVKAIVAGFGRAF